MLFDSHSHTVFSADSEMPAEEALRAAKAKGLGLVFTEHCSLTPRRIGRRMSRCGGQGSPLASRWA